MRGSWFHTDCANYEDSAVSLKEPLGSVTVAAVATATATATATVTATVTAALRRVQIALGVVS